MPSIFQFCYFSSSFLPFKCYYMLLSNWEKKQIVPWKLILWWTIIAILVLLRCWWNSAESLGSHTICSLLDHHRHSLSVWKPPSLEIEAHVVFVRATLCKTPSLIHAFIYLDIKWRYKYAAETHHGYFFIMPFSFKLYNNLNASQLPTLPFQYFKELKHL